jgi:hypothetical protein
MVCFAHRKRGAGQMSFGADIVAALVVVARATLVLTQAWAERPASR